MKRKMRGEETEEGGQRGREEERQEGREGECKPPQEEKKAPRGTQCWGWCWCQGKGFVKTGRSRCVVTRSKCPHGEGCPGAPTPLEGREIKRDLTRKDLCVALEHAGYRSCQSLGSLAGSFMSPGVCFSKQQIGVYPLRVGVWDADHHHT